MSIEEIRNVLSDKRLTWSTSTGVWIDYAEELIEEIEHRGELLNWIISSLLNESQLSVKYKGEYLRNMKFDHGEG